MFFKHKKRINDFSQMTIEEAKMLFFKYDGSGFHMGREEPEKYRQYCNNHLSNEILNSWNKELLESYIRMVYEGKAIQNDWIYISKYIEVLTSLKVNVDEYTKKLLDLLDYSSINLDVKQKILIMESMAGRNYSFTNGGIHFIKKNTSLTEEMNAVLTKLVDFDSKFISSEVGWSNPEQRYNEALKKMKLS